MKEVKFLIPSPDRHKANITPVISRQLKFGEYHREEYAKLLLEMPGQAENNSRTRNGFF